MKVSDDRQARDALDKFIAEVLDGNVPTGKTITVAEIGDAWFKRKAKLGRAGDASLAQSKWALDHLVRHLGARKVRNVRGVDLEDAYAAMLAGGLSPKSVSHVSGVAHQVFEYARRRDYVRNNPARDVEERPKRADGHINAPEDNDVRRFLDTAQEHDFGLFTQIMVSAATGGRRSEVLGLRRKDILWDEQQVWFRVSIAKRRLPGEPGASRVIVKDAMKSEAGRRRVAVGDGVLAVLREYLGQLDAQLKPAGLVFPMDGFLFSPDPIGGRPYHPDTVNVRFKRVANVAGVGVSPHALRHYAATQVAPYLTETEMMGRFGWRTPTMVRRYAEYRAARDAEAAKVMDLALGSVRKLVIAGGN
jgi:integrase